MKLTDKTTTGIRTNCFSDTVLFLTGVLRLEIVRDDREKEFIQLKLPSGELVEVLGSKRLWQSFTTPPDWEVIIAEVRHRKEKFIPGVDDAQGAK